MKIAFIGLGIMGSRMAANLQAKGYALTVHNRTPDKAQELISGGATWADTPAQAAQNADILITMLAHPEAVESTALGDDGFLAVLPEGALWIDSSTVNPSFSRRMAEAAQAHSIRFLDAPVAGSKGAAASAELNFIVGGSAEDVEEARPLLESMGRRVIHVGEVGMGTSLKVVVNMMLAASMAIFSEGMALGQSLGLSKETLLNVLVGGPVTAPFVGGKREKITSNDFSDVEFPLQWMHKDLHLAALTAYESGTSLVLANVAKELYAQAIRDNLADGGEEQDFSAIYAHLNPS